MLTSTMTTARQFDSIPTLPSKVRPRVFTKAYIWSIRQVMLRVLTVLNFQSLVIVVYGNRTTPPWRSPAPLNRLEPA